MTCPPDTVVEKSHPARSRWTRSIALCSLGIVIALMVHAAQAEVQMQTKFNYAGWPNCVRLSNGQIELIITTDVGPRVIRYGFIGGQNLFHEAAEDAGKTGGDQWRSYGGHRLWHAPEAAPRTYAPDNGPVQFAWDGHTLKLTQPKEDLTGIAKQMEITLDSSQNRVKVLHRLTNQNHWDVELAPWCLTVMAPGGRAIFPQEPYKPHPDYLLPARPLVLWHYTDMADPRWTWGKKYFQLRQDPKAATKQKVGILNTLGWAAYTLNNELFLKRFPFDRKATYPDFNCNNETYTDPNILEVETLGPMTRLAPQAAVEHVEQWFVGRVTVGETDAAIDAALLPLLR